MDSIVDFCIKCRRLARLTKNGSGNTFTGFVICNKCNKTSKPENYTMMFHGNKIIQHNDFERTINTCDEKIVCKFNSAFKSEEDQKSLQCQICNNTIDPYVNLQCGSCSQTYCFNCLMSWMCEKSTCPNCKKCLTQSIVHPNRDWRKIIDTLRKDPKEQKEPLCKDHNDESYIFCTSCNLFICNKCVVIQTHKNHSLVENKQISETLYTKANERKLEWNSPINLCNNSIKVYSKNCQLVETIAGGLCDALNQTINDICKEFNTENKQFLIEYEDKLKDTYGQCKENESVIERFRNTKDLSLIPEVSKAFANESNLQIEVLKIIKETEEQQKENSSFCQGCIPFVNSFTTSLSEIKNDSEGFVSIKIGSEDMLQFWLEKSEENLLNILANFEEKVNSKFYISLELEENNYCSLISDKIKEFDFEQGQNIINTIQIKSDTKFCGDDLKINFKVFVWKINEKTESFKNQILGSFLNKIRKDIDEVDTNDIQERIFKIDSIPKEKFDNKALIISKKEEVREIKSNCKDQKSNKHVLTIDHYLKKSQN